MYERGAERTILNGSPSGQKLSPEAYQARFLSADALYAHMLTLLIRELKRSDDGETLYRDETFARSQTAEMLSQVTP